MRLVLSRKGFDSSAGRAASPVFDDGRLFSLPIPDKQATVRYDQLSFGSLDVGTLVHDLTRGRTRPDHLAHLDPDLDGNARPRLPGWRGSLGQTGSAQGVLSREGVGPGDLFLFFGWFRRVGRTSGRWSYLPGAPDLHALWGWLLVGEVVPVAQESAPAWLGEHPHLAPGRPLHGDVLYLASERLDLPGVDRGMRGAGTFPRLQPHLQLTAPGAMSRSDWSLPEWFHPGEGRPALGYHQDPSRWRRSDTDVRLRSVARGQEFVLDLDCYPEAGDWLASLFQAAAEPPSA